MEERKLNFNTPLMSVRRFASTPIRSLSSEKPSLNTRLTTPSYNCDSNMDQVTEPVAVPFMWEMIPGIAKNRAELKHETLDPVEFLYGGSGGRVLTERLQSSEGSAKEGRDESEGTGLEDDNVDSDVYSDALESLSPPESVSFSFNYSVSGLSGSDGSPSRPAGKFSVDLQTRDLMMSRFLPAAKAMALETPQHASRKQQQEPQQQLAIVPYEQPKEVKREPIREIKVLSNKYDPNGIKKYKEQDTSEDESAEENAGLDAQYTMVHGKGCGWIPKLRLLNPIPGLKVLSRSSSPVRSKAKKLSKDQTSQAENKPAAKNGRSSLAPKLPGSEKLPVGGSRRFNFSGELQKMRGSLSPFRRRTDASSPQRNVDHENRSERGSLTPRLHAPGTKSFAGGYRHYNYSGELRTIRGSISPYRNSRADSFPTVQNAEYEQRSHETTPNLRGANGKPLAGGYRPFNLSGELRPMRGSLSPQWHSRAETLQSPQNVDNGRGSHAAMTPKLRPPAGKPFGYRPMNLSGELRPMTGSLSPYRHSTDAFSTQQKERSRSPLARVGFHNFSGEIESITRGSPKFSIEARRDQTLQTSFGVEKTLYVDSINTGRIPYANSIVSDQEVWMESETGTPMRKTAAEEALSGNTTSQKSSETSESFTSKDLILTCYENSKGDDTIPPLLKSPSESWLNRTLPSVPSRPYTPKRQSPKLAAHETKWETIVKSSNVHHDHVRYSKELITHAAQKLKPKS